MAQIETWLKQDIKQLVSVVPLRGNIFSGDNDGNLIGVEVFEDGQPYNMTGNCYGYVIKADNQTEFVPGTVSGNKAKIVLPSICYNVVGPVSIVIKTGVTVTNNVPHGGVTIAACTSYVYRSQTDVVDDATNHILPSYNELADKLEDLEAKLVEAGRVNITQNKSGNVITVTTTDRNGTVVNKTLQEPTVSVTPHDGDFDLNVTDANGSQTVTIPNPNAELSDRAHVETVSRSKTRTGNPIQIEDAVNEIADKTVIKLVPKQDLHGYSRPWVGGAGKNLFNPALCVDRTSAGVTTELQSDGSIKFSGTPTAQNRWFRTGFIMTLPAGTYFVSWTSTHAIRVTDGANSGATLNSGHIMTLSQETSISMSMIFGSSELNVQMTTEYAKIQIEKGSVETEWEPFENLCPISGYDTVTTVDHGVNVLDTIGKTYGKYISSNGEVSSDSSFCYTDAIPVKKGETWYIAGQCRKEANSNRRIIGYDSNDVYVSQVAYRIILPYEYYQMKFEIPEGISYIRYSYSGNTTGGRTDIDQNPILARGNIYPIAVSLATNGNQTAGTVYSGTVTLLADGSGQVVVDGAVTTCTGSEAAWGANATPNSYYRAMSAASEIIACNWLQVLPNGKSVDMPDWSVKMNGNHINLLVMFDSNYDTVEKAKALMASNNLVVAYKLDTPVTYTLTANQVQTLLGYNYIYTDGAEIALTYRQESLATNETLLKLLPTGSASGNPVTFSDGADGVPLKQLVVNVEPKQEGSGTPSPTNIRPIRGWDSVPLLQTGKNLIAITATSGTVSNVAVTVNDDGTVKLNGTANADGTITLASGIPTKGGETYQLTGCPSEGVYNSTYWLNYFGVGVDEDGDDVFLSTYTAGSISGGISSEYDLTGTVSIKFKNGTVFNNVVFSPMLYNTSLSHDFEPGVKKTYSIALPSEAGTVYGGTITLDENGEGTLTVNKKAVDLGSYTWSYWTSGLVSPYFTVQLTGAKANSRDASICSMYPLGDVSASNTDDKVYSILTDGSYVRIRDTSYTDANTFKAAVAGQTLVYELATPVTYSLTADQVKTLLGTNIISSDAGTVSVKYFKMLGEEQDLSVYAKKNNPVFTGTNFKFGGNTFSAGDMDVLRILIDEWLDATDGYPVEPADPTSGGNGGIEEEAPVDPGTGGGSGGSEVAEEPAEP